MSQECIGILLVNTGTPAKPTPHAVRVFLSKFLMDKRIAPLNRFFWFFILHLIILPRRSKKSAKKYAKIWTEEGSPFSLGHEKLVAGLRAVYSDEDTQILVKCAMSYSKPSILTALKEFRTEGCSRLIVLPLYPQSAFCTTGSVSDGVQGALRKMSWNVSCSFIDNYHENSTYYRAVAASVLRAGFEVDSEDKLLFSFHSIPLVDIEEGDTYELQTSASSLLVASELGLERNRWTIGYKCQFDKGREWLKPYSSDVLQRWAQTGVKRVFMVCPGFAVDCLETLYDVGEELKPYFYEEAAKTGFDKNALEFYYVPCLDKSRAHLRVLCDVLQPYIEEQ